MASGTERVAVNFAPNRDQSSTSDLTRSSQARLACSYVSRSSFCRLSIPSVCAFPNAERSLCFVIIIQCLLPEIGNGRTACASPALCNERSLKFLVICRVDDITTRRLAWLPRPLSWVINGRGGAVDFFKTGHPPGRGGADVLRKALCQWDPP